ncbi:MAG: magnesium transporter [Pseudomonadales bacterium]
MAQAQDAGQRQTPIDTLNDALDTGTLAHVRRMLNSLPAAEVADLLESSPPNKRQILWQLIELENEGEILHEVNADISGEFLRAMDTEELLAVTEGLETDDLVDIVQQLPEQLSNELLQSMDTQDRQRLELVLPFAEDTAGGLMNTDTITVRPSHTMELVLRYLRRHEEIPRFTDTLIVVNRKDEFLGLLPLRRVLVSDPGMTVRELMQTGIEAIPADMPDRTVASLFERHDWVSAPVIETNSNKLLGRITIDDVVDVIIEDADHSLMSMAGLGDDEETFSRVKHAAPRRALWLGANLITAFIAAAAINVYQETIQQIVALAILMPIVASMGGVAGSQTLTIMIRGMALDQISRSNTRWLLNRELLVAALNGMLWALVVAAIATAWFGDQRIGIVIALAMFINLVTAALAGVLLPLVLRALNIDPALAGTVLLTTVTDVVGFVSFLGLATAFYM